MLTELLPMLLPGLCLEDSQIADERIVLRLSSTQTNAECPVCSQTSSAVHSQYGRKLADLPWSGIPVVLRMNVRKFFCRNRSCKRKIFTERLPRVTIPYGRQTNRLREEQRQLGLECGGAVAARTAQRQGFPASAKTHLRRVCQTTLPQIATPRHLGIDDWAMRKGHTYGTLLVDLEQHRPVDLLPDRSAATLEYWLHAHPGIEIITRDRAYDYAEGATRGAPDAIQVADRFHLVQNIHDVLQRLLERHRSSLRAATNAVNAASLPQVDANCEVGQANSPSSPPTLVGSGSAEAPVSSDLPPTKYQQFIQAHRSKRYALYCEVQKLRAQGAGIRQIVRQLGIHRTTVIRFLADQFPERASGPAKPSILDPHIPYLTQQLASGHDNASQLWRDLCNHRDFAGSRALVSRWVAANRSLCPPRPAGKASVGRPPKPRPPQTVPKFRMPSARLATWLLAGDRNRLNEGQAAFTEHLLAACSDVKIGQHLVVEFQRMLRERDSDSFDGWLASIDANPIPEFTAFAAGLRRDEAAIRAAMSLPYSNGQVEGQVTRLKLIKRSMYGAASFELLRRRVLAA